jgi:putative exosortase-associated protein (TIGR04073 family)
MKTAHKFGFGIIFWGLTLAAAPLCYGDDNVAGQIAHKFVRGVANTVTGWVEMPKQMYLKTTQGPPVIGTLQGIMEGVGLGFARTTAGLYEIATFPIPLPMHYEPLFRPEYVWQDEEEKEPD